MTIQYLWRTILVVACTFAASFGPVYAQDILKAEPTASRAEWAPLGMAHGRDFSTSDVTKIVVLGSGVPTGNPSHGGISIAVVVNDTPYLFDCGPGILRSANAATPMFGGQFDALTSKNLTKLFFTHLHFDHTEGLASFILSPWTQGRSEPPQVYGPPGTENLVETVKRAYQKTIHVNMFGLEPVNPTGWRATGHDVLPGGTIYQDDNITVNAIQNHHGTWDYSYAYRIVTRNPDGQQDRSILISGDTSPFEGWEEAYAGVDILIHEAYSYDPKNSKYDARAPVAVNYMRSFHTSTRELADVLKKARPKVAIVYHYIQFTPLDKRDEDRPVKEIKNFGYDGIVILAQDQDIY